MATTLQQRLLTDEEFLRIEFGPDLKAELDNGVIRMMAGGSRGHDRVQINLIIAIGTRLQGSGCRPSASDMGVRTHGGSVRYPDVSVTCGHDTVDDDRLKVMDDPRVVIEVLSPSTALHDSRIKIPEYQALPSVETIALIDPELERLRVWHRGGRDPDMWSEVNYTRPADLELLSFGLVIPHAEIFRR